MQLRPRASQPVQTARAIFAACSALAAVGGGAHAYRALGWNANDLAWLDDVRQGLGHVWTAPGPFGDWRPLFGTWLWFADQVGLSTPRGMASLALGLWLLTGAAMVLALRSSIDEGAAWLAGALVLLHPGRHEQLFWVSAHADGLWVFFGLLALGAATSTTPRRAHVWGTSLACVCAALAKETATLLVLVVAAWPNGDRSRRRSSFLAGGLGVAGVWLARLAIVDASHYLDVARVSAGRLHKLFLFPSRLTLPFDVWRIGSFRNGDPLRIGVLLLGSAAGLLLAWSAWRQRGEKWARASLVLLVAGAAAWAITPQERSAGLGACAAALMLAGLMCSGSGRPSVRVGIIGLALLGWPPLWLARETQWLDAQRIGRKVTVAVRDWRSEAGTGRFLIGLATPVSVRGAVTPALWELDDCAIELAQCGAWTGFIHPRAEALSASTLRIVLSPRDAFATSDCSAELGIRCQDVRWPNSATIDVGRLGAAVPQPADCGPPDIRWWNGARFVPLDNGSP